MNAKENLFLKLWSMPILLSVITLAGLLLAIMGTGVWHFLSWLALAYPVYIMSRYGMRFFK